ncbi:Hypothetical protein LUCI_1398 [Lucifera butyrica]|uniref:UPF0235 protein LUCI_1398 n=1 Tax=Lucifera butyrica TaxID=1351585 RepID=A0A498R7D9_9FIRM|nr:DUF167 domain-containing protein [Lucifera butyrica]VBB06182.1 Hypothetical protein LUCI_1398 [Lucifera butyrica]
MAGIAWDIRELPDGLSFKVKVQPRASRSRITGIADGALKLALTSPPVDGEANEACIAFLAKAFHIPLRQVSILSGQKGRNKILKITGLSKEAVLNAVADLTNNG